MTLTFSRRLALAFVLGACLLYGAWRTAKDLETGRPWLPAAWVVGIKGVSFLLAIVALAGSLRQAREKSG